MSTVADTEKVVGLVLQHRYNL